MRKLASIQKIIDIRPIDGADRIVVADVLGWEVVVKKGDFQIGELVCYLETDSHLPPHPAWDDFMASRKYRVKTARFRKQYSQGLVIPIADLPELAGKAWQEEDDVTELLKIKKWEPGEPDKALKRSNPGRPKPWYWKQLLRYSWGRKFFYLVYGKGGHNFPSYLVPHTDETRIQAAPGLLRQALAEENKKGLYSTEKIDGQSGTYALDKPSKILRKRKFLIASRNYIKSPYDGSNWSTVAKKLGIENKLRQAYKDKKWVAVQGEIIGPGIQKNKYNRKELEFYVFNIFDIKEQTYYDLEMIEEFCRIYSFATVPILDRDYSVKGKTTKDIVKEAAGQSKLYPTKREGLVVRAKRQKKVSFKAVDPGFLLKHGDE